MQYAMIPFYKYIIMSVYIVDVLKRVVFFCCFINCCTFAHAKQRRDGRVVDCGSLENC